MGIVREPDGVDFVVSSGRWSPEVSAEVDSFARQVSMIGFIAPEARTVTVVCEPTEGRQLCEDARLSGEDVLPGLECEPPNSLLG